MPAPSVPIHPDQNSRQVSLNGIPLREDTAYSNQRGQQKGGIRKRAEKAIELLRDALLKVLGKDEVVFYVARGRARPSGLEEFFLGWLAYGTHGGVFVFTNQRLLYFGTDGKGRWQRSVRGARWGDIVKAHAKGWVSHSLSLEYRNGVKETYWKLRGDDARKIKVLLAALREAGSAETSPAQGMVNMCPNCAALLTPSVYKCPKCGLEFKDEKTMVRRSLTFPGLGYAYAGHSGLAVLDFLIEAVVLFEIGLWTLISLGKIAPVQQPGESPVTTGSAWATVVIFVTFLCLKKWLTIRHCRRFIKEFIPAS